MDNKLELMRFNYKIYILPLLIAFCVATFYIIVTPVKLKNDALEYDQLASSILTGNFAINGEASMQREPGYPFFRAIIEAADSNIQVILWIQVILYLATIVFIGLSGRKLDHRLESWSVWGASLSYGLGFYASAHLSEMLIAFLLAASGLCLLHAIDNPQLRSWSLFFFLCGLLLMTKYTLIFVPIAGIILLIFSYKKNNFSVKKIIKHASIGIAIMSLIVGPWLWRNYAEFGEVNVAGRLGGVLYARAWKAEQSWRAIPDSYLSALIGRGILFTIYPSNSSIWTNQWGDWWRDPATIKAMWGTNPVSIDQKRKEAALKIIFGNFNNFSRFIVWTGIDEIRMLQLSNPVIQAIGSPIEGTYGPLAMEGKLSAIQLTALAIAHIVQLFWLIGIFVSAYLGFKKYSYRFIPGILLLCFIIAYAPADDIPRYGAPLQPWLLSAIFMTILFPAYTALKQRKINGKKTSNNSHSSL